MILTCNNVLMQKGELLKFDLKFPVCYYILIEYDPLAKVRSIMYLEADFVLVTYLELYILTTAFSVNSEMTLVAFGV